MRRGVLVGLAAAALGLGLLPLGAHAAPRPQIATVVEGRDTHANRAALVVIGRALTRFREFQLISASGSYPLVPVHRSGGVVVLSPSSSLPSGDYVLEGRIGARDVVGINVTISNGGPLPGTVGTNSLRPELRSDLDDADALAGRAPAFYRDASNLDAGTLSTDRFSAYESLVAEGRLGSTHEQLAQGDHEHDERYFTKAQADDRFATQASLAWQGTLNDASNPVTWSKLRDVPAGIADGVDNDSWTLVPGTTNHVYRPGGLVGIGTSFPRQTLTVVGNDGVAFMGQLGSASENPPSGGGARMLWYPSEAAFRAGYVDGSQWDLASLGRYSVAMGRGAKATGESSVAFGIGTASGTGAVVLGSGNASGSGALAAHGGVATGSGSTAIGLSADATGDFSLAAGVGATASGYSSFAMGWSLDAAGDYSTAINFATLASGDASTAMGGGTIASGTMSVAMGEWTTAQAYESVALGRFNSASGSPTAWVASDPVLVVGNGNNDSARSNCFTLLKNGSLTISGTLTQNSDATLKTDVAPLRDALGKVKALRGVTYRLKDPDRGPAGRQLGLIAQDVRAVLPELVAEDAQGTLSVAYGNLTAVLIEALKEQQAQIEDRDAQVAALRAELSALRASVEERLARLESSTRGR